VLEDESSVVVRSGGRYLGCVTNNVAEYEALIWGLQTALDQGVTALRVCADSELMVRQVNGVYRVKNEGLKPLHAKARSLLGRFVSVEVVHVRREQNSAADDLANQAMDIRATCGDGVEGDEDGQQPLF
jgi:ribonuclease HI